ncbi:unnamed protein product [Effrenium voratum]|nr:unnamed protein product [Effrenium voratum]
MISNIGTVAPPNVLVARQGCLMHEINHVSEIALKTLGDLSSMFCLSSLLTQGSIFLNLLVHARSFLDRTLRVSYEPCLPETASGRF